MCRVHVRLDLHFDFKFILRGRCMMDSNDRSERACSPGCNSLLSELLLPVPGSVELGSALTLIHDLLNQLFCSHTSVFYNLIIINIYWQYLRRRGSWKWKPYAFLENQNMDYWTVIQGGAPPIHFRQSDSKGYPAHPLNDLWRFCTKKNIKR